MDIVNITVFPFTSVKKDEGPPSFYDYCYHWSLILTYETCKTPTKYLGIIEQDVVICIEQNIFIYFDAYQLQKRPLKLH